MSFWKEHIQSNNQRCDSQNRIVVPNGGYRYPKAKRVVDSDNALFQVNVAPAKPGDLTNSHPRVCHNIEHGIPMGVFGVAEHIVKEQFLLSHGQCLFLLTLKAVGELQFFEHIVCWVLSNHSIIDCHLKDLMEYIMDIIYRGNLQNLAVSKGVVELPHIRLFYLDKSVLSERRFYKQLIHINIILVYYNHRDEKGCYFSINTPKTKAGEREIPMTEGVKQAFLMEREFQSQAEISSKSRVDGYDDFIFVNRYGDVQNQGNLNKALRRMMRDCNDEILEKYGADSDPVLLPQFSCHILRHTFATRLCESGANLKFIQSILGHADVSTTMNIYVDVTDALKKKEITAFDDYMTTKLET